MAKLDLNHEKGNEAEHGSTPVEALSVGVKPIPRQSTNRDRGGINHCLLYTSDAADD